MKKTILTFVCVGLSVCLAGAQDLRVVFIGKKVAQMLRQVGVKDVRLTLYPGGRHEMLNETNRQQVYEDLLAWAEKRLDQAE